MIRALKMMIRDEALALKLTPYLQQRLFHVLQAEHLDVGFMLSGFRRRHKVSQRPLRVLERLPRRERRVSKGTDGRVVEAVCMEYTNFGEDYEVSPQQSMRAALRGLFPRNL